jgi:chromatin structure-remodeling complex subunit RSC9
VILGYLVIFTELATTTGWYTEHVNNNRMVLSLKSGIHHEVNWALDRLCRLCDNDKFHLKALPGLIQALFEWPQWYLTEGISFNSEINALFSTPLEHEKKTRHALLSMLVLRSASQNTPNAQSLAESPRTRPLILDAFQKLDPSDDSQAECLLWTLEFYLAILAVDPSAGTSFPPELNPIPILSRIASTSTNRALLVTSLNVLANLFSNPSNVPYLKADSPVLDATLRYLPVFTLGDTELTEACVMYLFAYLSNQAMAKAFLHHQDMPTALRLLVQLLISDQVETTTQVKIIDPASPVSSTASGRTRRLMKVEADLIGRISEPGRTIQW